MVQRPGKSLAHQRQRLSAQWFCHRMASLLLLFLALWIPLLFVPEGIEYQNVSSIQIKETVFLLLCPLTLALTMGSLGGQSRKNLFRWIGIVIPAGLLAIWVILLFWRCPYPGVAFRETHRWLCYLALFLSAGWLLLNEGLSAKLWNLSILASGIVALYGTLQFFGYDLFTWGDFPWALPLRRVCSSLGNPVFLGGYLVLTLPLTLASLISRRSLYEGRLTNAAWLVHILLIAMCVYSGGSPYVEDLLEGMGIAVEGMVKFALVTFEAIFLALPIASFFWLRRKGWMKLYPLIFILYFQLVALMLTFSVGSVIGLSTGFGAVLVLFLVDLFRKAQARANKKLVVALVLIAIVVAIAAFPLAKAIYRYRQASVVERSMMYQGAMGMIEERPLTGFGPGTLSVCFPRYRPAELALYLSPSTNFVDHVHSEYLEIASEFGAIGLALYFWILAVPLLAGLHYLWGGFSGPRGWLIAALLAGIVGTLAQNVISVNLRQVSTASLFWLSLGWIFAQAAAPVTGRDRNARGTGFRIGKWAAFAVALALCIPDTYIVLREYIGDLHIARGIAAVNRSEETRDPAEQTRLARIALHEYRTGLSLAPSRTQGHYLLGALHYQMQNYESALDSYQEVVRLEDNFVDIRFNQATTLVQMHRYEDALDLYRESLEQDPKNARLHDYYARALYLAGYTEEAEPMWEKALGLYRQRLRLYPEDAKLHYDVGKVLTFLGKEREAVDPLRKAVELQPDNPLYRRTLNETLVRAEAKNAFEKDARRSKSETKREE